MTCSPIQTIAGIICSRGGYGAARFTDKINFELIKNNPKVFPGLFRYYIFTYTIGQLANLVTFHGPMLISDIAGDDFAELSAKMFEQLFEPTTLTYDESVSK